MKDRLDPLIAERAPWLFQPGLAARCTRAGLDRALSYDLTVTLATGFADTPGPQIMHQMATRLARDVQVSGLGNVPAHGAALIIANHPTGIGDGIMLWHALSLRRPDLYYFANADILRVLPQMRQIIAPVEWRPEKRSRAKMRETMAYTREAVSEGRPGVIFPSGRLAKRRGLRLYERPWMTSAAMFARKFELPVVPINIRARNSALFYLFDRLHPTLRDITLFHETLNKDRQPFRITIGEPIQPHALPQNPDQATEMLRRATLALGGRHAPAVSLVDMTLAKWVRHPA